MRWTTAELPDTVRGRGDDDGYEHDGGARLRHRPWQGKGEGESKGRKERVGSMRTAPRRSSTRPDGRRQAGGGQARVGAWRPRASRPSGAT
jgi:hypothetical protein